MNALRNLRIGTRLALSFTGVLVLIAVLAGAAYLEISTAQEEIKELTVVQAERLQLASEWRENIIINSERTLAIAYSADKTLGARFAGDIKKTTARTSEIQQRFAQIEASPEALAIQEKLAEARKLYVKHRDGLLAGGAGAEAPDPATAEKASAEFKTVTLAYVEVADQIRNYERARSEAMGTKETDRLSTTKRNFVVTALACALMAGVLGWLLARSVVRPLSQAQRSAELIARGDLSGEVPQAGQDEVGQLLQSISSMQHALRHLVGDIRVSVQSIGMASAEVAAGNQDLSARTEQASASLQQTAASVEQISGTIRQSTDSANEADDLARKASEVAGEGGQAVLRVVSTMDAISQSSQRIGDIVGVIDSIAFQTNILALNAAVEAARAGEHGRGFAVVASEVRALAQRSATAAKEIKELIAESLQCVEAGTREARTAGRIIESVVGSVRQVSGIVSCITAAANEQARGIGEVNQAVSQLDTVTQQNAALVEQSAAAASSLKDQAQALSRSVERFKLA